MRVGFAVPAGELGYSVAIFTVLGLGFGLGLGLGLG